MLWILINVIKTVGRDNWLQKVLKIHQNLQEYLIWVNEQKSVNHILLECQQIFLVVIRKRPVSDRIILPFDYLRDLVDIDVNML